MSVDNHYDLVVIGSGPAGEKGAAQAAYFGKRVALIERAPYLGGAGINTGTLPSKTLRETALYFSGLRQRGLYGIDYSLKDGLTVADFMHRKDVVIDSERKLLEANLARHGITVIHGAAALRDAQTVLVRGSAGDQVLTADVILLATGSAPYQPPHIPFDDHFIYDSDSILRMQSIPRSLAVVGGGVIGSEYASIFTALGTRVTLIDTRQRLLPFVDAEIAEQLRRQLEQLGLQFFFNAQMLNIDVQDERVHLHLKDGRQLETDSALIAAGRQSNVQGLGLEAIGVELGQRGLIRVNEHYQTSVPNIYAAGDVIGFPALASTSMEQARVAMVHAFNLKYKESISPILPLAVYTIPEIAMVGLSEEECREKDLAYLVGRAGYGTNPRGQIIGDLSGLIKLLFAPADKKLLGVHIIGESASELIHIGSHVMAANGTIDAFIQAVYNYPTLADAYKYAAYDGLGSHNRWLAAQATR